ncbi:MAG: tripartite tricarboxylate transporter TctB family protein [Paracoccaceae bacterium]
MSGYNPGKRRPDWAALVVAVILALVAGIIWHDAARLPQNGGYGGVGPADVPRWIAVALALLAVWSAVATFREEPAPRQPQAAAPVLWLIAGLLLQLLLLKPAGFSIATGILFACSAAAFGRKKLWITLPVGIVFGLVIYAIFGGLLELSLPAGPMERVLTSLFSGS